MGQRYFYYFLFLGIQINKILYEYYLIVRLTNENNYDELEVINEFEFEKISKFSIVSFMYCQTKRK